MSAGAVDPSYRQAPDSRALAQIPGCDGWPVLGETAAVVRDLHAVAARHVRDYGPVSRIRLLGQGRLMVTGADLYQRIFQDAEQLFSAEKGYDKQLGAFYPRGLPLMDFDEHRANRRLMQGAFKVAALQPGAGSTLGPAMAFAPRAVAHMTGEPIASQRTDLLGAQP